MSKPNPFTQYLSTSAYPYHSEVDLSEFGIDPALVFDEDTVDYSELNPIRCSVRPVASGEADNGTITEEVTA